MKNERVYRFEFIFHKINKPDTALQITHSHLTHSQIQIVKYMHNHKKTHEPIIHK